MKLRRGQALPVVLVARFWEFRRRGLKTAEAARHAGISKRQGQRLMQKHGGVIPRVVVPSIVDELSPGPSSRYLSVDERDLIAGKVVAGLTIRQIAADLGRSPSTISREIRRHSQQSRPYRAGYAQRCADRERARPKARKLEVNEALRAYVWEKLTCDEHWSPQQISARLRLDHPDDGGMRISHEAIYRTLYVLPRGEMKKQVTRSLRSQRAARQPRTASTGRQVVPRQLLIAQRPAEVDERVIPGDWEGDCIVGRDGVSQIGTLVERTTRFTILLHLPTTRTGEDLRAALQESIGELPAHLLRSITWDQGSEMRSIPEQVMVDHDVQVWFCDPHSPWQRGTNENTNGLLRQYFPKKTDLAIHDRAELDRVAGALNRRPRAVLGFRTPAEAFAELLASPRPC